MNNCDVGEAGPSPASGSEVEEVVSSIADAHSLDEDYMADVDYAAGCDFVAMDRQVNDAHTWVMKLNRIPGPSTETMTDRQNSVTVGGLDSREVALRLEGWGLGYHRRGHTFICGGFHPVSPIM